ncbi:metalloprotease [Bizionia sediminis]|uniref:Metalloprotease n=1 Tax=Bizionia sediminis TaxID=1737064 RepID=A0ABW5KTC3_9FLAO
MKIKKLFVSVFFAGFVLGFSQNKMDIRANFNVEKSQIQISQLITYYNNTADTLQTVYLNDWNHSFATKKTPLAKRFAEEFKTEFHFAKNNDRGYSVVTSVTQNNEQVSFTRIKNMIDVLQVNLTEPALPNSAYTIRLNYIVQVPKDKFTRYGVTENGDFNLRYWYITPAVYNGNWHYSSNKDLDDMFVPQANINLEITCPPHFNIETELDRVSLTKTNSQQVAVFTGKNRVNSKLFLKKNNDFREIETDYFTLVSNVDDENLSTLNKVLVTDNIAKFLTDKLGPYPHKRLLISDIDYRKSPIYGLNLLPNFIRPFPDHFQYELKILKTGLRNYLENVLQLNPRTDQWLIDGLQIYYLMAYVDAFYPDMKLAGTLSNFWGLKSFHATQLDFNAQYSFLYLHMARQHIDQPLLMEKDSLLKFNENIANKYKAGIGLKYVDAYLENDSLPKHLKTFLERHQNQIVTTSSFERFLKSKTHKDLNWFFGDYLETNKYMDFKITKAIRKEDSIHVTIKNRRNMPAPISLFAFNNQSLTTKIWTETITDSATVVIPDMETTRLVLNYDYIVPEYNVRNNTKLLTKKLFNKPLQVRLLKDIEDPAYNQVFLMPIVEFNNIYDGIVLGAKAYNKSVLRKPFYYKIAPQYGLKSNALTGSVSLNYRQYFNNTAHLFHIDYGIGASYASYAENLFVTKYTPGVQLSFRNKSNLRSNKRQYLNFRYVDINRDTNPTTPTTTRDIQPDYGVFNMRYRQIDKNLVNFSAWFVDTQFSEKFGKIALNYEFRKLTETNRQYNLRFFTGVFLYNKTYQDSNYFSFALDRPTDYLFDYNYYGRSESTGLFSQQLIIAEGGFKSKLQPGFANQWLSALNGSTTIWKYILAYGDLGMIKNHDNSIQVLYDTGIRVSLLEDYFELYFPVYSNLGWEVSQPQYAEKIRFIVTLDFNTLFGLFTRRWY